MTKGRLEAFSDGVIAIIITIMVLEIKVPHGHSFAALRPLVPVFCSYVLSFVFIGVYWNNHHHTLHAIRKVNGPILWANLHLLFWLSLIPFVTGWLGESPLATAPVALYGIILFGASIAYYILTHVLITHHGNDSILARAIGTDGKGKLSSAAYLLAIALAFVLPAVSCALYIAVAIAWLVPDRRIEKVLAVPD